MYLDLSRTYPARDASVMQAFRKLSGLQVLKLRGISLRDEEIEVARLIDGSARGSWSREVKDGEYAAPHQRSSSSPGV